MPRQDKDKTNSKPDAFEYELPGGYQVLAGKTDAENDFLSIKFAAPNDYWFHVRGCRSHVILRVGDGAEPVKRYY